MKLAKITALLAAASLNLGLASIASAQSFYSTLDLGIVSARALNASGQVAGLVFVDGDTQAFYTGANGVGSTTISPPAGGFYVAPRAIADNGQVAGIYLIQDTGSPGGGYEGRGFITGPQGQGFTPVESLDGLPASDVTAINAHGQMLLDTSTRAYLLNTDGTGAHALNTLGASITGNALNASGQVVGSASVAALGETHAFLTGANGVGIQDLGTLGEAYSEAYGVNASGQVVGFSRNADFQYHGFYTGAQGSGMKDLGTFGGTFSIAKGINDLGQAVGQAELADGSRHAFVTNADGLLFDLNAFVNLPDGVVLENAVAINNAGQILVSDVDGHNYLLTASAVPVPEAQTSVLMLLGLGAMGWAVKRKAKPHTH